MCRRQGADPGRRQPDADPVRHQMQHGGFLDDIAGDVRLPPMGATDVLEQVVKDRARVFGKSYDWMITDIRR